LEGFKANVNSRVLNNTFQQLSNLEEKILNQNYKPEQLRVELRRIYTNYRTIMNNEPFIDLVDFEKYVVSEIYRAFE